MRSSKLQEVHLNKTSLMLGFGKVFQPFDVRVTPSVVDREEIFYFTRVAKKFNKLKICSTVNTFHPAFSKAFVIDVLKMFPNI